MINCVARLLKYLNRYLSTVWLSLLLALLFIVQNLAFNNWFDITPNQYFFRLCAVSFSLGLALYGPAIFFKKRGRYIYLLIVSTAVSFFFVAQFVYFAYSGAFLQASAIRYAGLAGSVAGTIKNLLAFKASIFCVNIILVILAWLISRQPKYFQYFLSKKEKLAALLILAVFVFSGYQFVFHLEKRQWGSTSRLYSDLYDLNALVGKVGIINFSLEDIIKYVLRSSAIKPGDIDFVKDWVLAAQASTTPEKYFGLARGRNVIYIQVESLENAVIGQVVNGQEITPNLNRLTQEGLYFNNYYSEVGPGNTADTEFTAMNSLYSLPDDVAFVSYAQNSYLAFPQLLRDSGYHAYAFHGDVATFWNRSNIYPYLGFEKWFSKPDFTSSRPIGAFELGDEDFFNQSVIKLKTLISPFFATLITLSSHTPFELPADLNTLNIPPDTDLNWLQKGYLQSIHYTDQAIGGFIENLKQNGLYDNSIIVIYGDHQSYTDIASALGTERNVPASLVGRQVPLIILIPGSKLKATVSSPASHLDLYPTVVNLLGLRPPKSVLGQDILNSQSPVVVHRNSDTGTINTILTPNLTYNASTDGVFEHGVCLSFPDKKTLSTASCWNIFNQQNNFIRASDIVVRGNLLNLLLSR
ncbi:MAG: LTA synthase family protein [Patescibacteria group bacterium]